MLNAIHLDPKLVPASLRGSYSGRKFKAIVCETVTIPADAGLWSGGSRDHYYGINLQTGQQQTSPASLDSPWSNARREHKVTIHPGFAVVRSSIFCGTDMGLTFYVHPQNAAALLPAPSAELSEHEQIVLNATCSLKSSHNGRDRYQMACEHYSRDPLMTREQWNLAKASLQAKGLLNKAGAVTVAGKNARK